MSFSTFEADGDRRPREGIGIPKADQTDLFKSFHRATNIGAISDNGPGLTNVELPGGTVPFVIAETARTTFTVRLPA